MVKVVLQKFIKDKALFIAIYLLNLVCIITFFHLSVQGNDEVFYPVSIGLFFLTVYLVIEWFRYYPTHRAIELMINGKAAELQPHTEEQKSFQQLLTKIVREHTCLYNGLKEKNKERIYFISHWLHYLKTPVSVIELMINSEEKLNNTEKVFESILKENKRLHTTIEQGLTVLRMESFENDLEVTSIDLLGSLRKVINRRKRECIYHSIYPSIQFERDTAFIITDSKWNEILLDQLIGNAIKYSSTKSGNKRLIFRIEEDEIGTILSITDEGVGIPDYDLERVFEPFFTGENGRKFPNSSGIGLYLCKKITEKLGQTITILSEVSIGTTVTIRWLTGKKHNL